MSQRSLKSIHESQSPQAYRDEKFLENLSGVNKNLLSVLQGFQNMLKGFSDKDPGLLSGFLKSLIMFQKSLKNSVES